MTANRFNASSGEDRDMNAALNEDAPRTDTQLAVASIWAEALQVAPGSIMLHDSFFSHGGRSLSVFLVLERLYAKFGVEISAGMMFEDPTVFSLAQHVDTLLEGMAQGT